MSQLSSPGMAMLAFAMLTMAHEGIAQPRNSQVLPDIKPNFYITTPQTGEQKPANLQPATQAAVAPAQQQTTARRSSSRQVASAAAQASAANYNTYTQQVAATPVSQAAYAATNAANYSNSYQQAAAYTANANTGGRTQAAYSSSVVNTSAGSAASSNRYLPQSVQQKQSFISNLFHKKSASAVSVSNAPSRSYSGPVQSGTASWYGSDFDGGKTANGERYNMESMTAAHKSLPFGTLVKVRNERNGQECVVRINNRGPYIKGRILDVSKAAARELGMIGSGVAKISMQVIGRSSS